MRSRALVLSLASLALIATSASADDSTSSAQSDLQAVAADIADADIAMFSERAAGEAPQGLRRWFGQPEREPGPYDSFSRPVTNLIFHHPFIWNEIRPLFVYHWFPDTSIVDGGNLQAYALQLHFALTDDLQLTAYKDGYVDLNTDLLPDATGFADIAFGLKYKVWEDEDRRATAAIGLGYETKSGAKDVLEGSGSGTFDLFGSYARNMGCWNFIGTAGFLIPRDTDEDNRVFHWHLHADYPAYDDITPFIEVNGFSYLSNAERNAGLGPLVPLGEEAFDYTSLGSDNVDGNDVITWAIGARFEISEDVSLGAAYEVPLTTRQDLLDKRLTLDLVLRF